MNHIIGIMAMTFGFIGMAIGNYAGAYLCFGYAFVLWCVLAVYELYEHIKKDKCKK